MSTRMRRRAATMLAICACLGIWACGAPDATTPAGASTPATTPLGFANEGTTPQPTPKPSAEVTPKPSAKTTPKPSTKVPATPKPSGQLTAKFISSIGPVSPGDNANATVKTVAGAKCTLVVSLKSGPSKAQGLGTTQADDSGMATWTWHIGLNTTKGSWPVAVTCTSGSAKATAKTTLVVQ